VQITIAGMNENFEKKIETIQALFAPLKEPEKRYEKIMALGREAPPLDPKYKIEENIVPGCQSVMYLRAEEREGKLFFEAESDALISAGLAALLIKAYSGEPPETLLTCPPDFLDELEIGASLTPGRANGLYSILTRMKQEAVKVLAKGA